VFSCWLAWWQVGGPSVLLGHRSRECMYSTIPIHWNIKSAPASPGRSRVGPSLYVFSLLLSNLVYAPASPGRRRVGPSLYVFCLLLSNLLQPAQAESCWANSLCIYPLGSFLLRLFIPGTLLNVCTVQCPPKKLLPNLQPPPPPYSCICHCPQPYS
jgi:hypothetical protein